MDLARLIDHTILSPLCTPGDIKQLCEEALKYQFAAVCLPPFYVREAFNLLEESDIEVVTVAGFPFGYSTISAKVEEIKKAFEDGANEIDAMINLSALKGGHWNYIKNEVESLATVCHMKGKILKLILETGQLSNEEIERLCEMSANAGVDFVKTSTGFIGKGASVETVAFLRNILPSEIKIKASGDVHERHFAEQLVAAGANRIGSSASVQMVSN